MVKDNHKQIAGSIPEAITNVKNTIGPMVKISVEVTEPNEAEEAYKYGADIVLLGNMSTFELSQVTHNLSKKVLLEASGNIDKDNMFNPIIKFFRLQFL